MTKPADLHTKLQYALAWIHGKTDLAPQAGIILGSGLSGFTERLLNRVEIPYEEIPAFPVSRVAGHPGKLVVGELPAEGGPVVVAAMSGRAHAYEGWSGADVAFGARVLCRLGIRALVVTNAAGGVAPSLQAGDLVRITDHLNLSGVNPLVGDNDERLGPRFPELSEAYDRRLGAILDDTARALGIPLKAGVYACLLGPSYETPAEIRMLRLLGADCVGMSTVPEVIAARHLGVAVCGISVVTNPAAGLSATPPSHEEVARTAERVRDRLGTLVEAFLPRAVR